MCFGDFMKNLPWIIGLSQAIVIMLKVLVNVIYKLAIRVMGFFMEIYVLESQRMEGFKIPVIAI